MILKNARIWSKEQLFRGHIVINEDEGIISDVVKSFSSIRFHDETIIDLENKLVIPSLIDIHSHLRDFEESNKETYESGAEAAAAGGFTHVFDMPNKKPPINSFDKIKEVEKRTKKIRDVSIIPFLLLNENTERPYVYQYPYVKAYLGLTTGNYLTKFAEIKEFIEKSEGVITIHCEDKETIEKNESKHLDIVKNHCEIRGPETELGIIDKVINMFIEVRHESKIHIAHVTLKESVDRLRKTGFSFEVTPHHLLLNKEDYQRLGIWAKMNPPLRSKEEQEKLWKTFLKGLIPIIATDHAPHTKEEKKTGHPSGVPEFETALASILSELQPLDKYKLDLVVKTMALNPRQLMGISSTRSITPNEVADLTVIDLDQTKKVSANLLKTKCKWSPWEGEILKGWPIMTIHNGCICYNDL
ncbi:MAG: dihydroorotase [Candidatus Hodarchaeales archaeon]